MKHCAICRQPTVDWYWEQSDPTKLLLFTTYNHLLSSRKTAIPVCDACKQRLEQLPKTGKQSIRLEHKFRPYLFNGVEPPYCTELTKGYDGIDAYGAYTILCRHTASALEPFEDLPIAKVYDETLAEQLIKAYDAYMRNTTNPLTAKGAKRSVTP